MLIPLFVKALICLSQCCLSQCVQLDWNKYKFTSFYQAPSCKTISSMNNQFNEFKLINRGLLSQKPSRYAASYRILPWLWSITSCRDAHRMKNEPASSLKMFIPRIMTRHHDVTLFRTRARRNEHTNRASVRVESSSNCKVKNLSHFHNTSKMFTFFEVQV